MNTTYHDIDENGEDMDAPKMASKAREGKTDLQLSALKATSTARNPKFPTTKLHKRFRNLEAKANKGIEESIVFKAWMTSYIEIAQKMNNHKPTIPITNLIAWMENEDKWQIWKAKNWSRVLAENKNSVTKQVQKTELKFANRK
ncbi:MAG TPA: hypothetical protein PLU50_09320 [Pseudobdellovibrionaceae bacterium]|nr:hypothetical protein [Pseudobdellovibrionaceae bacterium]